MIHETSIPDHLTLLNSKFNTLAQEGDFAKKVMIYLLNDKGQKEIEIRTSAFNNLANFETKISNGKIIFTKIGEEPEVKNQDVKISAIKPFSKKK